MDCVILAGSLELIRNGGRPLSVEHPRIITRVIEGVAWRVMGRWGGRWELRTSSYAYIVLCSAAVVYCSTIIMSRERTYVQQMYLAAVFSAVMYKARVEIPKSWESREKERRNHRLARLKSHGANVGAVELWIH